VTTTIQPGFLRRADVRTLIGVGLVAVALCVVGPSIHAQGGAKPAPIPPAQIRAAMESYVKFLNAGDAESIMTLYGENPSIEDPIGNKPIVGRDAVRAFYKGAAPRLKDRVRVAGRIVVTGLEGAMPMLAELGSPSNGIIDVVDVMTFDTNGKIIVMRAYVSPR